MWSFNLVSPPHSDEIRVSIITTGSRQRIPMAAEKSHIEKEVEKAEKIEQFLLED